MVSIYVLTQEKLWHVTNIMKGQVVAGKAPNMQVTALILLHTFHLAPSLTFSTVFFDLKVQSPSFSH